MIDIKATMILSSIVSVLSDVIGNARALDKQKTDQRSIVTSIEPGILDVHVDGFDRIDWDKSEDYRCRDFSRLSPRRIPAEREDRGAL
jgi:hypothetical protein